jgi:hypothetical protein
MSIYFHKDIFEALNGVYNSLKRIEHAGIVS